MKHLILLITALFLVCQLSAREVININKGWKFFSSGEGSSDGAITVNLPHSWNRDALSGQKDYYRGVGNYVKELDIPIEWRNKRVYIRFTGVGTVANIIVNGRDVGEHRGGQTAFTFELSSFLKYGERNTIWVVANNAPQMDVLPTAGDNNIYGGIYRDVNLIVCEPSHISLRDYSSDGVYMRQKEVSSKKAELDAIVKIDGLRDRNLTLNITILTPQNDIVNIQTLRYKVPADGFGTVSVPITIDNPTLWNGVKNPYLYSAIINISDGEFSCDSIMIPFGIRTFNVDSDQGFLLNGEPYPINGVVYYEDRATVGPALADYQISEDLDLMQEMGVNTIRAAGSVHNPEFYAECDRRGIIVWSDTPFTGPAYVTDRGYVNSENFKANGRQQLQEMIYQNFNHPSVIMWGIFSNLDNRGEDPSAYISALNALARQEDPSRFTAATSNNDGNMNFIPDLIVWDHSFGWKEGLPSDISLWLEQLHSNWKNLRSAVSYGAGGSIYHQEDSLYRPQYTGFWHPERWQTHLHEEYYKYLSNDSILWGTFVANMFDYGAAGRVGGEGNGVDTRGVVSFDRKYRKDAFFFYKANWNKDDLFVEIAEKRWNSRHNLTQTFKVYSNDSDVELLVNGISQGVKTGTMGTFLWEGVLLKSGLNLIEARGASQSDYTRINISAPHKITPLASN